MKLVTIHSDKYSGTIAYAFFGVALLLVALVLYLTYVLDRQYKKNARWVIHTHRVLTESEYLVSLVKDAQRGQRGYIFTGDSSYLRPYVTSKRAIGSCLLTLGRFTRDQPVQQQRLLLGP